MGRHLLISYPKSGRTWLRFLLNQAFCIHHNLKPRNVFEIEKQRSDYPFEWTHLTAAMVMKLPYWSMGQFDPKQLAGLRAFLLVREPCATLASAYFQATNRIRVFNGTPSEFVRSHRYGAMKLATFFNLWNEIQPAFGSTLVAQYEDALARPQSVIESLLSFLDLPMTESTVQAAIDAASFENMKRLSVTPEYAGTVIAPTDPNNPDSAKVRAGKKTGYRDLFSDDDIAYIKTMMAGLCVQFPQPSAYSAA